MQIIFQKSNGERVPVSEEQFDLFLKFHPGLVYLVQEKKLVICCLAGNEKANNDVRLKYHGGKIRREMWGW